MLSSNVVVKGGKCLAVNGKWPTYGVSASTNFGRYCLLALDLPDNYQIILQM